MINKSIKILNKKFQNIFLVQNRNYWNNCPFPYDKNKDLILTFDLGLLKQIKTDGGNAAYLDHIADKMVLERYNHAIYNFLDNWNYNKNNIDIFLYKGIEIGNAFLIEILSEITYYVRIWINILALKDLKFNKLFIGVEDEITIDIITKLKFEKKIWDIDKNIESNEFYFPIFKWLKEQIHPSNNKQLIKSFLAKILDVILRLGEVLKILLNKDKNIFVQSYWPTKKIINFLINDKKVNVILEDYIWTKDLIHEKRISIKGRVGKYKSIAKEMLNKFQKEKSQDLNIKGINISDGLYEIIIERISKYLSSYLQILDSIIIFFSKRKLNLMILISNMGVKNSLLLNYCKKNNIPSYIIINGILSYSFFNESKEGTWINSYGKSMKQNYFCNMKNIVCLGDPRMDDYMSNTEKKSIDTIKPTIIIGAAGFDNIDLNSYIAFEFDFLDDILSVCKILINKGKKMNLVIKVRPNGYINQYIKFVEEYYSDIPIKIYDKISIKQLLIQADLYISIFSQTLFEASCMGIPVLYYKKDTQILYPPFDGKSELVTAISYKDLIGKIELFYKQDKIYDKFKDKKVMEKYIGPLDGNNLKRNIDFVYSKIN